MHPLPFIFETSPARLFFVARFLQTCLMTPHRTASGVVSDGARDRTTRGLVHLVDFARRIDRLAAIRLGLLH